MSHGTIFTGRNVNQVFQEVRGWMKEDEWWRLISPRGIPTKEYTGVVLTEYVRPTERVLFSPARDANPFFHFFEALWILNGSQDVAYLAQFNSNIANFSDDGVRFHAAYGHRIRHAQSGDQLLAAIEILRADHDTRQAVLQIWDANTDLGARSKDIPCNDLVFLKVREGALNMTVCCRSNDIIWGAYGANVVQFSTLQEFIARAVGVQVGTYTQVSDSFHFYHEREDWLRIAAERSFIDPYEERMVRPYPLMEDDNYRMWLEDLALFIDGQELQHGAQYFHEVALPMFRAWQEWQRREKIGRSRAIDAACEWLESCAAEDWALAGVQWLERRRHKNEQG